MILLRDTTHRSATIQGKNTTKTVSYATFFGVFKSMKIFITDLGIEECEKCELYKNQQKQCNCENYCDANGVFPEYLDHICDAINRRREYNIEKDENREPEKMKLSVDLQKVVLLPRLDMFKCVIFTSRLVIFNETFSQLG